MEFQVLGGLPLSTLCAGIGAGPAPRAVSTANLTLGTPWAQGHGATLRLVSGSLLSSGEEASVRADQDSARVWKTMVSVEKPHLHTTQASTWMGYRGGRYFLLS